MSGESFNTWPALNFAAEDSIADGIANHDFTVEKTIFSLEAKLVVTEIYGCLALGNFT